jgi:hypothetical protein
MKQNKTATDNQPRGKQNKLSGDNLKIEWIMVIYHYYNKNVIN